MKNGDRKSQEGIILSLFKTLFIEDLPRMHRGTAEEFLRDYETISKRTSTEGLSFLTKTLPRLGKAIDAALLGDRLLVQDFKYRTRTVRGIRVKYALPNFLWVLLSRVFNPFTGHVLGTPDVVAVNDLRQVCFLAYKLELPYDKLTIDSVLNKFVATDAALPLEGQLNFPVNSIMGKALAAGNLLLRETLADMDHINIQPKHGPGVVATGEEPWEKYNLPAWYHQLEAVYPYEEYCCLNRAHYWENLYERDFSYEDHGRAKVVLVPKDSRGPRLISCEPLAYQYIQQGIAREIVRLVEKHPLSRGRVNFTDQSINGRLALQGSKTERYSTLDLSEASDRVSMALVEVLFEGLPLLEGLRASRSPETVLPDNRVVRFRKFAPMGSALCFPIMALSLWALGAGLLHVAFDVPVTKTARWLHVYGDDIIVRKGHDVFLTALYPKVGLKINSDKSCTAGRFRESCGCDAFAGEEVTPLKLKTLPPTRKTRDARPFLSYVAYSNTLWTKGYYSTAEFVRSHVEKTFGRVPLKFNFNAEGNVVPSWYHRFHQSGELPSPQHKRRWNDKFQRFEFSVLRVGTRSVNRDCPVWCEILRSLSKYHTPRLVWDLDTLLSEYLMDDPEREQAYVYTLPRRVQLKRGWSPLYY